MSEETTHQIDEEQEYTFGYLEVLENRDKPDGNTIKLPVYIFKSRGENPKPDPIIYTVGGPGYTSMRASKYMEYYQYLDDRDFILFEQRGTQYAQPSLDCPEWAKAVYEANLPPVDEAKSDNLFQQAAKDCGTRLRESEIDLNSYTTTHIAADINDLMEVLGFAEYNLLTLSYSTKIGQVLLRDYPEKIRSVVMDSPLPLEVNYDEESVGNLLAAVDKLLADCENDPRCDAAYPNLKQRFFEYLEDKTEDPLLVEVENPNTGKLERFYLKGEDLITVFTSASSGGVPNIPLEVNKLLNGDLSSVKKRLEYVFNGPGSGF
ncbi:MAG: alpha/beta fold hydrolase, partial [Myxococcota bacterium]